VIRGKGICHGLKGSAHVGNECVTVVSHDVVTT
jgi:hypothetical protein